MPLQNRVDPWGHLHAADARGTLTGNRGVLHDAHRRIIRQQQTRRWIVCVLDFRGRRRTVMTPGRWTELFFLDEATALAAGHRPCFLCRRRDAVTFATLWNRVNGCPGRATAAALDRVLDRERRQRVATDVETAMLPDGVMLDVDGHPHVTVAGGMRGWSFQGYGPIIPRVRRARLITPEHTTAVIAAGYPVTLLP